MKFLDNEKFELSNIENNKCVYFPLCNENIKGSITPFMNGDLKTDHHHFALEPSSNTGLLNDNNCRNVWFKTNEFSVNLVGNSLQQLKKQDKTKVEYGFLYQNLTRSNKNYSVNAISFIPMNFDTELHKIKYTNTSKKEVRLTTIISVPLYGRSADNLRDHRHVTALLNRVSLDTNSVNNTPTFSFDERGHILNDVTYSVTASTNNEINRFYPTVDSFIGNGNFLLPDAIYKSVDSNYNVDGYEVLGGIEYKEVVLQPNESFEFVYGISISNKDNISINKSVVSVDEFNKQFELTQTYWQEQTSSVEFFTKDKETNNYLKWVTIQPILRRIFGCSFLPHHDYGKGGRGFRDLWQDCLSLIKINPSSIKDSIINNFAALRIDGSNATIIGSGVKDFKADRNDIVRMWMDHGVWPLVTTYTYLKTTNDYDMLLNKTTYFKDNHISFSQEIDKQWDKGLVQKTINSNEYNGTILEHLLLQNITSCYNLGLNNNIKLMDADWNDGLDMAHKLGESVAFTALYAQNLNDLCTILDNLNVEEVELFEELYDLINDEYILDNKVTNERLQSFFSKIKNTISGNVKTIKTALLKDKLNNIFNLLSDNINKNEWLESNEYGYYNGYYDNDSKQLERIGNDPQMVLTSQVFTISSGIASDEKVSKIVNSADKLLYDNTVGGYRLNTNFNEVKTNMGRLFGFAYGHKENGAVFSHMAVMYANSLYKRGFVDAGYKVINTIKESVCNYSKSKMLPGIPEYFDQNGVGMYPYLTGSASWLLLTMVEEVFGIKRNGDLLTLDPKLTKEEFNKKVACINFNLDNKRFTVKYYNKSNLNYGEYSIKKIIVNGVKTKNVLLSSLVEVNLIEVYL